MSQNPQVFSISSLQVSSYHGDLIDLHLVLFVCLVGLLVCFFGLTGLKVQRNLPASDS